MAEKTQTNHTVNLVVKVGILISSEPPHLKERSKLQNLKFA